MINEKTAFIIGAGASKPYNFPTGRELRNKIISEFEINFSPFVNSDSHEIIRIEMATKAFIKRFRCSGIYSIDRYLSFNPGDGWNGKIAIALEVLRAESQSKFDENLKSNQNQDWYSLLYNRLIDGITPGKSNCLEFANNNVSLITFNYDRSLEYYLHRCFTNTFPEREYQAGNMTEYIPFPFLHVYGAAKLPWQSEDQRSVIDYYNAKGPDIINFPMIKLMAENLRTIYEERQNLFDTGGIIKQIRKAETVFFLGFGYADENLKTLDIPESIKEKKVFGTALGFTDAEIKNVLRKLKPGSSNPHKSDIEQINNGFKKGNVTLLKADSVMLLRNFLSG